MKPMLLTSSEIIPKGEKWIYEAKYDGYRCLLQWDEKGVTLLSRNEKGLNEHFPEIIRYCEKIHDKIKPFLPLLLDGEIVRLESDFTSDFNSVQLRGHMRRKDAIASHASKLPCHYVVFDLLRLKKQSLMTDSLEERKMKLTNLFKKLALPLSVNYLDARKIQAVRTYKRSPALHEKIISQNGEGMIAKQLTSTWVENKRTDQWVKIKNWRYVDVILIRYNRTNGYFYGAVYKEEQLVEVVVFQHGLAEKEEKTLISFLKENGLQKNANEWELSPSVCIQIACIGFDGKQLREPRFHAFSFQLLPNDCDWKRMQKQLFPLPHSILVTHPDKPIWPYYRITKDDYLLYLQQIAPYLLPFLKNRYLTSIRYPHGAHGERFYQKNCPDYAPAFVKTAKEKDINYIVCNDTRTLLWLGNQLAIEFHIPFQTYKQSHPSEIVFDLDPPSVEGFPLAIKAAIEMKAIFDRFHLHSFVKTSGGKGLQVYIPLPDHTFSYADTRIFTEFVCRFLCEQHPHLFTLERLKKKRDAKLYLDYMQHEKGKTIIAPFSPRGNDKALVATPLYWEEVSDSLKPDPFTILFVINRLKEEGNPFQHFFQVKENQPFQPVLDQLKKILN